MSAVELAQALHGLVGELDSAAEELLVAGYGVTHSQLGFLMPLLREGPLDVSSLAAINGVSIAAVSKRVSWFVDRGLIEAAHPSGESKRVVLSLTRQGRRLAAGASARLAGRLDELLAAWPEDRRLALQELVLEVTSTIRTNRGRQDEDSS